MTITKKTDGDTLTVVVDGWLDTMTAPKFQEEVQDLGGAKNVVLDFGGAVSPCSRTGRGVLGSQGLCRGDGCVHTDRL